MAFVADVKSDENGGDLLNDAGVLQLSSVEGANSRNFSRQFANALSGVLIIAADDDVTIDRALLFEKVSGQIMKCRHYHHSLGYNFRSLLRGRALPDTESAGGLASDTGSQRDGGVNQYLSCA